ncbi:MAG: hypothetical protein MK180_03750 [Rhodobacteraceae bacterium]|nr:hypothetical protein [Paracoccaceae bacterium]
MKFLKIAAAFTLLGVPAFAGPQYIDGTGFAVSGYDVVSYFALDQSAVGTPQTEPAQGRADITAEHNGATFAFATVENRDAFLADPERYTPAFDGHCAYGVAQGGKVPANPLLWRIVDDQLYLNITKNVVMFWEEDIPGNITAAVTNWTRIDDDAASTRAIPQWTSAAPVTN